MSLLESVKNNQKQTVFLGIILIIASFLRIYQLGQECLWIDEVSSIDQALRPLSELFCGFLRGPAYYFLLRFWIKLFGLSEFSLRLPSAIFGIASVYLTYRVGKIIFNRFVGQISALLLAISAFHLFYSQEVRHYSFWVFLTLLSNFFFLKILNKGDSKKLYLFYCLSLISSLYTILWSVLMWMVHNLVFFCFRKHNRKQWIITQFIILASFLLWLIPFMIFAIKIKDSIPTFELGWIVPVNRVSLAAFFKTIVCSGIYFSASYSQNIQISFLQVVQICIFLTLFSLGLLRINTKKSKTFFLLAWLFLPIVAILIASWIAFPLFSERYLIFVLPSFLIFISIGIWRFKRLRMRVFIIALIVLLNVPALAYYYGENQKLDYKQAVRLINRRLRPKTNVVINSSREALVFVYYWEKDIAESDRFSIEIRRRIGYKMIEGGIVYKGKGYDLIIARDEKQINRFISNGLLSSLPEVWLILGLNNGVKDCLVSALGYPRKYEVNGLEVYHFKK